MAETRFIVIHDEDNCQEWPDSTRKTITLIEGDLADKVRVYYARDGAVTIHQSGQEGGYSEYTVEWDWEVNLSIAGEVVYSPNDMIYDHYDFITESELESPYRYGGRPVSLAQHLLDIRNSFQ